MVTCLALFRAEMSNGRPLFCGASEADQLVICFLVLHEVSFASRFLPPSCALLLVVCCYALLESFLVDFLWLLCFASSQVKIFKVLGTPTKKEWPTITELPGSFVLRVLCGIPEVPEHGSSFLTPFFVFLRLQTEYATIQTEEAAIGCAETQQSWR